jgi:hypothetical protein
LTARLSNLPQKGKYNEMGKCGVEGGERQGENVTA